MKAPVLFVFLAIAMLAAPATFAADESDRPVGIEAKNWLPISDRLGFVIDTTEEQTRIIGGSRELLLADPDRVSGHLQPPKKGYFVIKTEGGWQRVVVSAPSDLVG